MNKWLQVVFGACAIAVTGVFAYDKLAVNPTPVPDANPDLAPVLYAKLNPLLDGDNALYYAGVFAAASHVMQDDSANISSAKQLHDFMGRLALTANASEPAPVDLKAVLIPLFSGFPVSGEIDEKTRGEIVALLDSLSKASEASK